MDHDVACAQLACAPDAVEFPTLDGELSPEFQGVLGSCMGRSFSGTEGTAAKDA